MELGIVGPVETKDQRSGTLINDIKKALGSEDWWNQAAMNTHAHEWLAALAEFYMHATAREKHHHDEWPRQDCQCVWCRDYRVACNKLEGK